MLLSVEEQKNPQKNKGKEEDTGWRTMIIKSSEDFPDHNYVDDDDDIWMVEQMSSNVRADKC